MNTADMVDKALDRDREPVCACCWGELNPSWPRWLYLGGKRFNICGECANGKHAAGHNVL